MRPPVDKSGKDAPPPSRPRSTAPRMQGTMPGARRRGRPRTAWMDNIKTWTGLPVEESVRISYDRDKMEKVTSVMCPTLGSTTAEEQNRT